MGVQVIPIPIEVVSHFFPFPFTIPCFIPIPMSSTFANVIVKIKVAPFLWSTV